MWDTAEHPPMPHSGPISCCALHGGGGHTGQRAGAPSRATPPKWRQGGSARWTDWWIPDPSSSSGWCQLSCCLLPGRPPCWSCTSLADSPTGWFPSPALCIAAVSTSSAGVEMIPSGASRAHSSRSPACPPSPSSSDGASMLHSSRSRRPSGKNRTCWLKRYLHHNG